MSVTTLETLYREGRIIRRAWSGTDEQGRELLCLYTALAGDASARPRSCPAHLAPLWVAHLLPWLDDAPSQEAWPKVVERVIALAPHLHRLSDRAYWLTRQACVTEAIRHTSDAEGRSACQHVSDLLGRLADGDEDAISELETAAASVSVPISSLVWAGPWAGVQILAAVTAATTAATGATTKVSAADRLANAILDIWSEDLDLEVAS